MGEKARLREELARTQAALVDAEADRIKRARDAELERVKRQQELQVLRDATALHTDVTSGSPVVTQATEILLDYHAEKLAHRAEMSRRSLKGWATRRAAAAKVTRRRR